MIESTVAEKSINLVECCQRVSHTHTHTHFAEGRFWQMWKDTHTHIYIYTHINASFWFTLYTYLEHIRMNLLFCISDGAMILTLDSRCSRLDQHAKMLDIERRRLALIDEAERQAFLWNCPSLTCHSTCCGKICFIRVCCHLCCHGRLEKKSRRHRYALALIKHVLGSMWTARQILFSDAFPSAYLHTACKISCSPLVLPNHTFICTFYMYIYIYTSLSLSI